ncbi:MAG: flagellar biosynthesis anti-sigma factor FlgM [Campylobacterales bacterium]|nr:flagellar biosynthesis anti-sigma factor FlgM [Campylobacterales bacterium]
MISQVTASAANALYQESTKNVQKSNSVSKQGETGRIETIKAEIEKGAYRVDLDALAKKIAEELMP